MHKTTDGPAPPARRDSYKRGYRPGSNRPLDSISLYEVYHCYRVRSRHPPGTAPKKPIPSGNRWLTGSERSDASERRRPDCFPTRQDSGDATVSRQGRKAATRLLPDTESMDDDLLADARAQDSTTTRRAGSSRFSPVHPSTTPVPSIALPGAESSGRVSTRSTSRQARPRGHTTVSPSSTPPPGPEQPSGIRARSRRSRRPPPSHRPSSGHRRPRRTRLRSRPRSLEQRPLPGRRRRPATADRRPATADRRPLRQRRTRDPRSLRRRPASSSCYRTDRRPATC